MTNIDRLILKVKSKLDGLDSRPIQDDNNLDNQIILFLSTVQDFRELMKEAKKDGMI